MYRHPHRRGLGASFQAGLLSSVADVQSRAHRYVFLVAAEPETGIVHKVPGPAGASRKHWKCVDWLNDQGSKIVGAAWFVSRYQEEEY